LPDTVMATGVLMSPVRTRVSMAMASSFAGRTRPRWVNAAMDQCGMFIRSVSYRKKKPPGSDIKKEMIKQVTHTIP
jgi:hypothetical protein